MNSPQYKYFAFISYNSHDTKWGKRLQRKLEGYRMPSTLCSERGWKRKPINPVFFAPTDIQPGGLTKELQDRLRASRHLIVICSPNSARSEWVGREIEFFHSLGRTEQIHFFIVDGVPHSADPEKECFNPIVDKLGMPEILGANIHEKVFALPWLNVERAYVQLISKLLDVEFDAIWHRHRRRLIQKIAAWTFAAIAMLMTIFCVWTMNQPTEVRMSLNEATVHNDNLPPLSGGVVTMILDNEIKTDTLGSIGDSAIFTNVTRRFLNKPVRVKVACRDFAAVDTTVILSENVSLNIHRLADVYGNISFQLWNSDGCGVANVAVTIAGYSTVSDENGNVSLLVPLEKQHTKYHIQASVPLLKDTIYMPCGEDAVVRVKD